jgi:sterol desaturase/sphingolipid hydroxylase (fatty acid hydroxylase superfamily)
MVLTKRTIVMSQLIPLSPWIVMTWLAITVLGSLVGGLFIFLYECWAAKRGYQAWYVFAGYEGEVTTPGWIKLWWWVIVSIVIFITGIAVGIMLQKP